MGSSDWHLGKRKTEFAWQEKTCLFCAASHSPMKDEEDGGVVISCVSGDRQRNIRTFTPDVNVQIQYMFMFWYPASVIDYYSSILKLASA